MCNKDEIIDKITYNLKDYFYSYKKDFRDKIINDIINIIKKVIDSYMVIPFDDFYKKLHINDEKRDKIFIQLEKAKVEKQIKKVHPDFIFNTNDFLKINNIKMKNKMRSNKKVWKKFEKND